jgi:uncharacterized protein YjaZ
MSAEKIFESLDRYGVTLIIVAGVLSITWQIAKVFLNDLKARKKVALENEQKDHDAQLQQQHEMYAMVTEVQSQQVITLAAINKSIDQLIERQENDNERLTKMFGQLERQSENTGHILDKCVEIRTLVADVSNRVERKEN